MIRIGEDCQSVGKVDHILMKAAGRILRISEFIDDYADDLLRQNVTLVGPRLFALQIEPAEQLLFLGSEFSLPMRTLGSQSGSGQSGEFRRFQPAWTLDCSLRVAGSQVMKEMKLHFSL